MLDSLYSKTAGSTCAGCTAAGTDSGVCAKRAQALRGYTAGPGCTDTLVGLSPAAPCSV